LWSGDGLTMIAKVEGVTGQLDLPDQPGGQPFAGGAVQPHVLSGPTRSETVTAGRQFPDQVAEAAIGRVAASLGTQSTDHVLGNRVPVEEKALA
jgi:hypothetical protein